MRALLIAAKEPALAKTRLVSLPAQARSSLARAMFDDVLAAATATTAADEVAVISSDLGLLESARRAGAATIDERYPRGLNNAVAMAAELLAASGAHALCTLLSDTPLISARDIEQVMAALPGPQGVVMVPSHDGSGTNILVRRPPQVIGTHFGKHSLALHRAQCEQLGIPYRILTLPGPALDLDEMGDLAQFARRNVPTRTLSELYRLELAIS